MSDLDKEIEDANACELVNMQKVSIHQWMELFETAKDCLVQYETGTLFTLNAEMKLLRRYTDRIIFESEKVEYD